MELKNWLRESTKQNEVRKTCHLHNLKLHDTNHAVFPKIIRTERDTPNPLKGLL
jgi:hypothetical protein